MKLIEDSGRMVSIDSRSRHSRTVSPKRGWRHLSTLLLFLAVSCFALSVVVAIGGFPDPSVLISAIIEDDDLPDDIEPEHANSNAFEGGPTGTDEDAFENINLANLGNNDVPTDSLASPLFGAQVFTQQMLRFEEFGPVPLGDEASVVEGDALPPPPDAEGVPDEQDLDDFLAQYITVAEALPSPFPTREANCVDLNPWQPEIEAFLERDLNDPPAEGRPPGENWAHQRYQEFFPEVFVNTAQAGARTNLGLRDELQFHQYNAGEFAPGGLYHNTVGVPGFEGTTNGIPLKFHPDFPVQDPLALWTFDGTFPPKLLMARYGESVLFRHYNALPIDPGANFGFGLHTITTHEHNGHNPAESDGYTQSFFFPGQFYDYHWVMTVAGFDSINTGASDPRMGSPDGDGGITNQRGNWREIMSTHWFHDHMLDFTATNVYKGNVAMFNMYSSVDRGREPTSVEEADGDPANPGYGCHYADTDNVNLCFPSGSELDWGNRDYDVNLVIAEKAWDSAGQLFFNIFEPDGFIGDQILTNWLWKPYFEVRARRYRFRILNGSVSRYFRIALVEEVNGNGGDIAGLSGSNISYNLIPFHMICNDGNIMEHSVYFDGNSSMGGHLNRKGILPTQGIAERYDIIIDFAQFAPGTKLYFVNVLQHDDGRRPKEDIPIAEILSGEFHDRNQEPADQPVASNGEYDTDATVGRFLQFRVVSYSGTDLSLDPADYVAGNGQGPGGSDLTMIPLPVFTQAELDDAIHRTFEFGRSSGTDKAPWTIKTDGGSGLGMDPRRLSASVNKSRVEIWHIENGGGGWSHPIHVHFEEGQIFQRGGNPPPEWERWARKDIYRVGRMDDSTDSVDFAIRFREFLGTYMEHCHNTQHEDHAMLLRWDIENPGQVLVLPTPMPSWDGISYVQTFALPTFRTGDEDAAEDFDEFGHVGGN